MKKILGLIFALSLTLLSGFCADMRFVQVEGLFLSETNPASVSMFENLIQNINNQKKIEFVVFTGNNIQKPKQSDLKLFLKMAKKLKCPYYVVLGNKDVNKQKDFGKKTYISLVAKKNRAHKKIESPNYVFEKKGLVFIVVDGSKEVIPSSIGYYKPDVLSWLDEQLTIYKDRNVVILQHFPIVFPSERESYYTFKADEYLKLLHNYKNVKAVISGHFGVNKEQEVDGILHISSSNAPKYRIIDVLDYETANPVFWSTIKE